MPHLPHIKEASSSSQERTDQQSDAYLPLNYQLKTMCLAKKTVQMPNKEEHGFLLFCGLGARKWEVEMNCNSLIFKQAILNIYPRLRSVIGYNLYTVAKDKKTFERIPEKVNTPKRIRSYLGSHFTGCLIIVPVSDIVLMEEKREHLRQIDISGVQKPSHRSPASPDMDLARHRSLCLICGKSEKTPGTGSFYKIMEETFDNYAAGSRETIVKKLTEILGFSFETSKRKFLASLEICKKCLRTCMDIVRLEEQVKKSKEEMISNFFTTTSKYNKSHGSQSEEAKLTNQNGPMNGPYSIPQVVNGNHPFLVQPMAFLNPHAHKNLQYGNGYVQFLQPAVRRVGEANTLEVICSQNGGGEGGGGGSDYAPSEVGSSTFPPRKTQDDVNDEGSSCYSPKQFDTQSYASTFSFRSASSIRSKAEIKSYDEPICVESDTKETEFPEEKEKLGEIRKCESNDTSPFSQTSPRSTTSPKSESLASSPGPDDREEMEERMKPWKKRKIVQDQDPAELEQKAEKIAKKEDERKDSNVYQNQIDPGTSGSDH